MPQPLRATRCDVRASTFFKRLRRIYFHADSRRQRPKNQRAADGNDEPKSEDRKIESHSGKLGKPREAPKKKDLKKLSDWLKLKKQAANNDPDSE